MRLTTLTLSLCAVLPSAVVLAQTAVLSLDSNPKNKCEKAGEGAMWTLHDTRTQSGWAAVPRQAGLLTVTLVRIEALGDQPRSVVQFLGAGQIVDLGCAQGKPVGVSYQLFGQQ